jgi:hypothetical protein
MVKCIVSIANKIQRYAVYLYLETALHISGGIPPNIRSAYNCIYSIWYLSRRYCYLPLSWKSWDLFECVVGGVRHFQHTQTGSNSSTIAADGSNGVTNTRCCRYSCMRPWWWVEYHPKYVEQFPYINKLCNVASCWIYSYIGILLGARPLLHISRIRFNYGIPPWFFQLEEVKLDITEERIWKRWENKEDRLFSLR